MSDQAWVRLGRSMAAIGAASAVVGWVWVVGLGLAGLLIDEWLLFNGILAIGCALIAWLVLPTQPRNGAIWPIVIVAATSGLMVLTTVWAFALVTGQGLDIDAVYAATPSDLSTGAAVLVMFASWLFIPFILILTVGLVLFPDGRPPSPRWRWTVWLAYGGVVVQCAALMWLFRPTSDIPLSDAESSADFVANLGPVVAASDTITLLLVPICLAGMIVRFRRSAGLERQQFRLVLWGGLVAGTLAVVSVALDLFEVLNPRWPALLMIVVFLGAYGVAIGKYRLYDVDLVISRTFVYGTLAVFITAVYVGIVVGLGSLTGTLDEPNVWLGVAATVVIAVAFQPLRRWLQKVANRIVYGRRATPYEVLSSFSQRVDAVDPDVLRQVARSLTEGTTADATSIWVSRADGLHLTASWPEQSETIGIVHERDQIAEASRTCEIVHDGEVLGYVGVHLPPGQPFPPNDERLLDQVASGLGLALRNLQLTDDLQARVDQLRESRRRIVAVQDQTRRALERDLHDGAQQRLVALKIKVGIGVSMADEEGLEDVKEILDSVKDETDQTIESLRDLARGIYPPLLEAEGLGPALTTQLRRSPIPVTVQAAGLDRYPQDLEATIYFCILEAVQNAVKHSRANSVTVTLSEEADLLTFEVRDDGVGFELDSVSKGHGLVNLADRLDAVNGTLEVASSPDHGTQVIGRVPVRELVEA